MPRAHFVLKNKTFKGDWNGTISCQCQNETSSHPESGLVHFLDMHTHCHKYVGAVLIKYAIDLTPKHSMCPWAAVEGMDLNYDDQEAIKIDVFEWACKNYTGKKPEACGKTRLLSQ